jgi:alpha-beta hydrolase superfamily lysophospholipase
LGTALQTEAHRSIVIAGDGRRILLDCWPAENAAEPAAIVQILHGLGEHPARYDRFANACCKQGYAVYAHNHRGHGENCVENELGHFADSDGWNNVISDVLGVQQEIRHRHPRSTLVLLGHSMGSYIAQDFVKQNPRNVNALILSGSSLPRRRQLVPGHLIARLIAWRQGTRAKSELLNKMGFGEFNKHFVPNRTAFDWLSRDDAEVDSYVADPLCGADSSNGLWVDLTGALLRVRRRRWIRKIPQALPILITGGAVDPVGGQAGMGRLADAYRRTGHRNVALKVYPDGRHEMLNEINREDVTADLLHWIGSVVRSPAMRVPTHLDKPLSL